MHGMDNPKLCVCGNAQSSFRCACKGVFYCGFECSQQDWKRHKKECVAELEKKLQRMVKKHGADDARVGIVAEKKGEVHRLNGQYSEAVECNQDALRIALLVPESRVIVAERYARMGHTFQEMSRHDDAMRMFKEVYQILKSLHGKKDCRTALALNNIATIHFDQERYDQALKIYKKQYSLFKSTSDTINKGHCLSAMGEVYRRMGDFRKALDLCQEALEINTDVDLLGGLMASIGTVYLSLGSLESAEVCFLEALKHHRRDLTEKHPEVAKVLGNLAATKMKQGKIDETLLLHTKALKIIRHTLGANHQHVATSLITLAAIKKRQGHVVDAIVLLEQAISIYTSTVGAENSGVATALYNIALCKVSSRGPPENVEDAFTSIKEAHRIYTKLGLLHGNAKEVVEMMHRLETYFTDLNSM